MKNLSLKEILFLFALGSISSLSLSPYNFFIINFFTFSLFFSFLFKKLNKKIDKKVYFFYGWIFGFAYFLTNLYWITISLTFEDQFSFLIPFALILVPFFLAIFYGLVTITFILFKPKNIISSFFLFSLLFGLVEFIRGNIFTGFPWNLIIYSFSEKINFLSALSLIGTYSLNLIALSFFYCTCTLCTEEIKKRNRYLYFFSYFANFFFNFWKS